MMKKIKTDPDGSSPLVLTPVVKFKRTPIAEVKPTLRIFQPTPIVELKQQPVVSSNTSEATVLTAGNSCIQ